MAHANPTLLCLSHLLPDLISCESSVEQFGPDHNVGESTQGRTFFSIVFKAQVGADVVSFSGLIIERS